MIGLDNVRIPKGETKPPVREDRVVTRYLQERSKELDLLLVAPPSDEELSFEARLGYLDDGAWEALGIWC